MRLQALLWVGLAWPAAASAIDNLNNGKPAPQILSEKTAKSGDPLNWYATLEFRHHINTYYDPGDYLGGQEPSAHARLQVGTTLYDGYLDAYGTVGVYKIPQTQQVFQRRPQLALDVYPLRHDNFTLLQYNMIQLPFDEAHQDPESDATATDAGTIYTAGFAPSARWSFPAGASRFTLTGGVDGWTKMYSRAQATDDYKTDENDSRLGLEPIGDDEPKEIEDYAQHYFTQALVGIKWDRLLSGDIETSLAASYRSDYEPFYEVQDGATDYKYKADRYSFYKWRMKIRISERLSFINDFYHFHDGLFAAKRRGEDNRRFRNIARIQCKL